MVRLLCAGLGGMGRYDWSAAAKVKGFRIVGGVDVSEAARKTFEEETGRPTFTDLAEAIKKAPADAALIATPDAFHAPYSIQAMKAGLDVICEKPMAATLDDARKMHRTAEQLGRMLMIHHQLRWLPTYYHARKLLCKGLIGKLRNIEFDMSVFSDVCMIGYRSKLPHLMLKDLAIHHFDLIRFLAGAECERIFARSWISNEEHVKIPTTTNVYAVLDMAGPITACYRSKMRSITDQIGYCCRAEMTGSKGVLTITGDEILLQTYRGFAAHQPPRKIAPKKCAGTPWPDFAKAIQARKPTLTASGDNLKSVEVLYAAIESVETGKAVALAKSLA